VLDGLVVAAVALIAGADVALAARLGVSMTALQASIGALNDVVDADQDAERTHDKPIPAGLITADGGRVVVVVAAAVGLVLAAISGTGLLILAGLVLVVGFAYDLVAKGTAWSWVPFAVGIPILPVYGWYGATGGLADWFAVLLPAAVLAGTALAIANALADVERDRTAGTGSIAVRLGEERSWAVHVACWAVVIVLAIGWLVARGEEPWPAGIVLVLAASSVIAVGVGLGRRADAHRRERAWEVEAVGAGLLAVAWLAAIAN
jgi:4-hydroxybenzoate polyprenyltransferase